MQWKDIFGGILCLFIAVMVIAAFIRWTALFVALLGIVAVSVAFIFVTATPSNDKRWRAEQSVLSFSKREGDLIHIYNVHNFSYKTPHDFDVRYYDATYNLNDLTSVDYAIAPFSRWRGLSHTFISFGFADGRHLAISIEARKEQGRSFSLFNGVMRQYTLIYIIGDEQDTLKLRTNYRRDPVVLYPLKLTRQQMRALLIDMLEKANELRDKPEFFNSFTSSCTTNLIRHINQAIPDRIPWSYRVMLPGYSDGALLKRGLIDTTLSLAEARQQYRIDTVAQRCGNDRDFSKRIREREGRTPGSAA